MNIRRLKARMIELGMTTETLAGSLKVNRSTLYRKFKRPDRITLGDLLVFRSVLRLNDEEMCRIFFS